LLLLLLRWLASCFPPKFLVVLEVLLLPSPGRVWFSPRLSGRGFCSCSCSFSFSLFSEALLFFSAILSAFIFAAAVSLLLPARRTPILVSFLRDPGARVMEGLLPEGGTGGVVALALTKRIGDRRGRNGVSERLGLPGMESLLPVPLLTSAPSGAL